MARQPPDDVIARTLNEADIYRRWNPLRGDCAVIAAAIQDVFGGELRAISSVPHEQYFDHVVVQIDGALYDGRGAVSAAAIEDYFVRKQDWSGPDAHWFTVEDISSDSMYNAADAEEVAETLRAAKAVVIERSEQ